MKKVIYTLLSLGLVFSLASCGTTNTVEEKDDVEMERPVILGMANPFIDCESLEEAENNVGFTLTLPSNEDLPSWVNKTIYRSSVVNMKLLEIIYPEDDTFEREIRIRKGITDKEEISGDYNSYESEKTVDIDGVKVNTYSNGDLIYLATWNSGEYK